MAVRCRRRPPTSRGHRAALPARSSLRMNRRRHRTAQPGGRRHQRRAAQPAEPPQLMLLRPASRARHERALRTFGGSGVVVSTKQPNSNVTAFTWPLAHLCPAMRETRSVRGHEALHDPCSAVRQCSCQPALGALQSHEMRLRRTSTSAATTALHSSQARYGIKRKYAMPL